MSSLRTTVVIVVLVIHVNVFATGQTLTVRPNNTVVFPGPSAPVVLTCQSNFGAVSWLRFAARPVLIASACTVTTEHTALYSTRSHVTPEGFHQCDLVLNVVNPSLAGTYRCSDNANTADASAVVLDSSPVGKQFPADVFAGDRLYVECSVNYTGKIQPSIRWIAAPGGNNLTDVHTTLTTTSLSSSGYVVAPGGVNTFITPVTCTVEFPAGTVVYGRHNWTSGYVGVQHCPTDVTIYLPAIDSIPTGTVLGCFSHAQPANVTYSWYSNTSLSVLSTGQHFTVREPGRHSLTCVATNYITSAEGRVWPCSANKTVNINAYVEEIVRTTTTTTTAATTTTTATAPVSSTVHYLCSYRLTNEKFTEALSDKTSAAYRSLDQKLHPIMVGAFVTSLENLFVNISSLSFRSGSVVVETTVQLRTTLTTQQLNTTTTTLYSHLAANNYNVDSVDLRLHAFTSTSAPVQEATSTIIPTTTDNSNEKLIVVVVVGVGGFLVLVIILVAIAVCVYVNNKVKAAHSTGTDRNEQTLATNPTNVYSEVIETFNEIDDNDEENRRNKLKLKSNVTSPSYEMLRLNSENEYVESPAKPQPPPERPDQKQPRVDDSYLTPVEYETDDKPAYIITVNNFIQVQQQQQQQHDTTDYIHPAD